MPRACLTSTREHCNRPTFASRLVMAGMDLRPVQALGGWRSLAMVQRYAHLNEDHLRAAVERLVTSKPGDVELGRNLDSACVWEAGVSLNP